MEEVNKNLANEAQVKEAKLKEKRGRERELDDVRYVLNSKQGRRFLWRYLAECGVYRSSFNGQFQTFFNEGQRNVGLKLLADIQEASPEAYVTMMKESKGEANV